MINKKMQINNKSANMKIKLKISQFLRSTEIWSLDKAYFNIVIQEKNILNVIKIYFIFIN